MAPSTTLAPSTTTATTQQNQARESIFKKVFFSIYSYTIIYALFGVLSLSYHACFNSSLSTLEKRYHFSSSTGGYIMITDNIATVLTNLFIGYYGKTAHKPRWMAIGCLVTGTSVMITSLPYFIYGPAKENEQVQYSNSTISSMMLQTGTSKSSGGDQMCLQQAVKEDCSELTSAATGTMTMVAVSCFAISNFFRGFGTSIYFTYGTPYLDDNVSKAKMPTFFAFIFAARIFGAPIGFYLSSLALKHYENPFSVPPGLTNTDPRWIGAWWIGFLVSGTLMLLLAIPLFMFPREFRKKTRKINQVESVQLVEKDTSFSEDRSNGNKYDLVKANELNSSGIKKTTSASNLKPSSKDLSLKELPREVLQILTNPIIICQMMGNLFRGIGIIGYFVFQTKYLESQFRQSASKASLISGTTGFAAKIFGVLFGGLLITLFRPGPRSLTTYIFIVELTSVFTLMYGATVIGPQYSYPGTNLSPLTNQLELNNSCNANCHCELAKYQPVCDVQEMKAYFSPCHAGCQNGLKTADNNTAFFDCKCSGKLVEKCPPDSDRLIKYATIVALGGMISGSSRSGNMVTFFRSINPDQKSLAVAVGSFWHSLFVSIPYPIIYGKIFDYCCLVWRNECGEKGNCWLYDTERLRFIYHTVSIVLIALGSVFDLIMIFLSPRLGNLYDDEEGKKTFRDKIISMFSAKKEKSTKNHDAGEDSRNISNIPISTITSENNHSSSIGSPPQSQQQSLKITKL